MKPHPKYRPILTRINKLNPSVHVLAKVASVIRNPHTELADIEGIIRTDASLTSDIIRMSNSSFYGYTEKCSSLIEALKRIGLGEAQKLINLSVAKNLYTKHLKHYQMTADDCWAQGLACALILENISKRTINHNDAYTIGTVHGVGKSVIDQVISSIPNSAVWDRRTPLEEWELSIVGIHYGSATADLLQIWKFPDDLCDCLRHHSAPESCDGLANALNFTLQWLDTLGIRFEKETFQFPEGHSFLKAFPLDASELESIYTDAQTNFQMIQEAFKKAT